MKSLSSLYINGLDKIRYKEADRERRLIVKRLKLLIPQLVALHEALSSRTYSLSELQSIQQRLEFLKEGVLDINNKYCVSDGALDLVVAENMVITMARMPEPIFKQIKINDLRVDDDRLVEVSLHLSEINADLFSILNTKVNEDSNDELNDLLFESFHILYHHTLSHVEELTRVLNKII